MTYYASPTATVTLSGTLAPGQFDAIRNMFLQHSDDGANWIDVAHQTVTSAGTAVDVYHTPTAGGALYPVSEPEDDSEQLARILRALELVKGTRRPQAEESASPLPAEDRRRRRIRVRPE